MATGVAPSARQQPVQVAQPRGLALGQRREVPGRAVEQLGARVLRATRLHAADRVAADEARAQRWRHGRDDARLGRADVGDRGVGRQLGQLREHARQLGDGRAEHDELGARHRRREVVDRLVDAAAGERGIPRGRVGIAADDPRGAGSLARGEPERAAHEAEPDDRDALDHEGRASPRINSARRKARSSDWRAFRRGSQSVM